MSLIISPDRAPSLRYVCIGFFVALPQIVHIIAQQQCETLFINNRFRCCFESLLTCNVQQGSDEAKKAKKQKKKANISTPAASVSTIVF